MKRFLVKTSIVLGALLVGMCLLDGWITRNLHHSEVNMLKGMNDVFFDSTHYDVVVMGSSRGLFQYDTRILDSVLHIKSYNAGINGRGIVSQIIKYQAFEKRHGSPKVIIHNVDCFLLAEDNGFEREQYLPYFFDKDLFRMVKNREGFNDLERIIPLIRYSGYEQLIKEGLGLKNKLPQSRNYQGYCPSHSKWDGSKLEQILEVGFSKDTVPYACFLEYLDDCRKKDVKIVFVFAPFYYGAQQKMRAETYAEMLNTFETLGEAKDIPVLSWWESPICRDTTYFYNATHLNAVGARLFTRELASSLDSLDLFGRGEWNETQIDN